MEFIKKGWQGEFKPLDIFLGSLVYAACMTAITLVALGFIHSKEHFFTFYKSTYILVTLPISIWLTVALWRSLKYSH